MNCPPFSEPPPSSEPPPASKLSPPAKQVPFSEQQVRDDLVNYARSLFQRGLSSGGSGNISVKLPDGSFLVTPTNSCLGELDSQTLSKLDTEGNHISGDKPSKEVPMHLAMYRARPTCGAVVHLHSPYLTALSCLTNIDHTNCLPPITPYYVMRIGRLPLLSYMKPGDPAIAAVLADTARDHNAALLANHGPVVSGSTLREAVFNAEELEDTARLYFLIKPYDYSQLTTSSIDELAQSYRNKIG
ncbi:putative aldolase [Yersinia wautersii]|uniref:3-oxo-tetronate 4-phosphate decarboxylase n=1 Tax=Yersinia wautersii TaxID=1341643 RepID=A0ABP1ZA22_9GAMM|nr:putative aldolase [Yersinia wautersii]